jgi:UDP-N-acetylmuramate--alanine ligase
MEHVHFIGIGGSGLSAIAVVLLESGIMVSGSDRQASPVLQRLQEAGAQVFYGHRPENIAGADLVVRSSAVPDDNVEVQAALAAGVPVLKRVDFLDRLTSSQQAIAVAGTHGKTTTTAMLAWILTVLGKDPSYIIGGFSINLARNAHAGHGKYFVIEADEYDHMFWGLQPYIGVVTNVEHDHPDCYPTFQDFYQAFQTFVSRLQVGGALVACGDDMGAASLLAWAKSKDYRSSSYGLEGIEYDYTASKRLPNDLGGFSFSMLRRNGKVAAYVRLRVPGEHNVRNALAALAVTDLLGLPLAEAAQALSEFQGTGRRFEIRGEVAGVTIIDDYAHHPTEIRATLAAAHTRYPERSIWVVWQPHTFSRTRTLFRDFVAAFEEADHVLVTEIYAARESAPDDGFSASQLVEAMRTRQGSAIDVHFTPGLDDAMNWILEHLKPGDIVLVLSAGDADLISAQLVQTLQRREKNA